MGAFRYCIHCTHDSIPLPEPSPEEDLLENQVCKVCGKSQPNVFTREEWIIKAFDEISELKKLSNKQRRKIKLLQLKIARLKK